MSHFDEHTWAVFAAAALASNNHGTEESRVAGAAHVADMMLEELAKRVQSDLGPPSTPADPAIQVTPEIPSAELPEPIEPEPTLEK
jgi:hypothetical protein